MEGHPQVRLLEGHRQDLLVGDHQTKSLAEHRQPPVEHLQQRVRQMEESPLKVTLHYQPVKDWSVCSGLLQILEALEEQWHLCSRLPERMGRLGQKLKIGSHPQAPALVPHQGRAQGSALGHSAKVELRLALPVIQQRIEASVHQRSRAGSHKTYLLGWKKPMMEAPVPASC